MGDSWKVGERFAVVDQFNVPLIKGFGTFGTAADARPALETINAMARREYRILMGLTRPARIKARF